MTSASAIAARVSGLSAREIARRAGVSNEAVELAWSAEVVDLHLESFLPPRLWGYDLLRRHSHTYPFGGWLFGHVDVPRALEGGLTGAMWSIATNIAQPAPWRFGVLEKNVARLAATLRGSAHVEVVRSHQEWARARAAGKHAALVCVQGGNAFDGARPLSNPGGLVTRVTVVHLSNSRLGETSSPARLGRDAGIRAPGKNFVEWLNSERIFVDLAHASPKTFWDALAVHDQTQPAIVTHTGAAAVHPMWRNIDASQVKAIADTGGVCGVILQRSFLGKSVKDGRTALDHLEAFIDAGGEGCAAIGTDLDGFIIPPPDLRDGATAYYRLVSYMLERRWTEQRIRGVLGENFLRAFRELRP